MSIILTDAEAYRALGKRGFRPAVLTDRELILLAAQVSKCEALMLCDYSPGCVNDTQLADYCPQHEPCQKCFYKPGGIGSTQASSHRDINPLARPVQPSLPGSGVAPLMTLEEVKIHDSKILPC